RGGAGRGQHLGPGVAGAAEQLEDGGARGAPVKQVAQPDQDAREHLHVGVGAGGVGPGAAEMLGGGADAVGAEGGQHGPGQGQAVEDEEVGRQRYAQSPADGGDQGPVVAGAVVGDEGEVAGVVEEFAQGGGGVGGVADVLGGDGGES